MDNWYLIFYLFSLADKISVVFGTLTIISGIWGGITILSLIASDSWDKIDWKRWRISLFSFLPVFLFSISLWTFTPNRKELLIIIAGGSVGNFVTTNDDAKAIPAEITKFLRTEIQSATKEVVIDMKKENLKSLTKKQLIEKLSKEVGN